MSVDRLTEISNQLMRRMKKSKRYFLLYMIRSRERVRGEEEEEENSKKKKKKSSPLFVHDAHNTCLSNSIEWNICIYISNELLCLMIFLSLSLSTNRCVCMSMTMFLSLFMLSFDRLYVWISSRER